MLTKEQLKEVLDYSPETGVWVWKKATRKGFTGKRAGQLSRGYRYIRLFGRLYLEHRLAFLYMEGEIPPQQVDHINRVRADNRWDNLRHASHTENCHNMWSNRNTSGVKGVSWDKKNSKWLAQISVNGKQMNLGRFATKEEAAAAHKSAAKVLHGSFAITEE